MESVTLSVLSFDDSIRGTEPTSKGDDQSLLQFALRMCRKHGVIKEWVTLLSPSDFLQAIQLCLTKVYKMVGKCAQADNAAVLAVAQSVFIHKLRRALRNAYSSIQSNTDNTPTQESLPSDVENIQNPSLHCADFQDQIVSQLELRASNDKQTENDCEFNNRRLHLNTLHQYDEFLANSNHVDAVDVLKVFLLELLCQKTDLQSDLMSMKIHVIGTPPDLLQKMIILLLTNTEAEKIKTPLVQKSLLASVIDASPVKSFKMLHDFQSVSESEEVPEELTSTSDSSVSTGLVKELFHSYMSLLVNTRSELAFAHVFNTPDRGLTHQAFIQLKHQAQKKKMSLYQMAMSLITQLRLGGRGYAPDPGNRLMDHVKGLGHLTDMMNKLQRLLENPDCLKPSVSHVASVIKKSLINCKSQRFKCEIVEGVEEEIKQDLEQVLTDLSLNSILISPDKPACQGGSLTSRRPRRVLLHYLDRWAVSLWGSSTSPHLMWLSDVPFGPQTPSRFPCVLSLFRSPATNSPSVCDKGQKKPLKEKKGKFEGTNMKPDQVDKPLHEKCIRRFCDTVIVLPSKTVVHPSESRCSLQAQDKENFKPGTRSPARKKWKKAAHSSHQTLPASAARVIAEGEKKKMDSPPNNSLLKSQPGPKQRTKCRRRLLPPPTQGQKLITSFFQR